MGSHNFMVTALGSCVKWPLVQLEHVGFVVVFDLSYKRLTFHLEAKPTQMECHKLPFFAASNFFGVVVAGSTVNLTRHRGPFINKYNLAYFFTYVARPYCRHFQLHKQCRTLDRIGIHFIRYQLRVTKIAILSFRIRSYV